MSNATRSNIKQAELTQPYFESKNVVKKAEKEVEDKIDKLNEEKKKHTKKDKLDEINKEIDKLVQQQTALIYVRELIDRTYNKNIGNLSSGELSAGGKVVKAATERMYAYMLGTVKKVTVDYIGNFIAIGIMSSEKVIKYNDNIWDVFQMDNNEKLNFFTNLKCKQPGRLASSDLSVRGSIEYSKNESLTKKESSKLRERNIKNNTVDAFKSAEKSLQGIREFMVSNADTNASTVLFTAEFYSAFKKITGAELDTEAVKNNDSKYLLENDKAITKASRIANEKLSTLSSNKNPFADFKVSKSDDKSEAVWSFSERFMRGMLISDANRVADEMNNVFYGTKRDETSLSESVRTIAALGARTGIYAQTTKAILTLAYSGITTAISAAGNLLGWEEDERELTREERLDRTTERINEILSVLTQNKASLDQETMDTINKTLSAYESYGNEVAKVKEKTPFEITSKMFKQTLSNYALGGAGSSTTFAKDLALEGANYWYIKNIEDKEYDKFNDAVNYASVDQNLEGGKFMAEASKKFLASKLGMNKSIYDAVDRGSAFELSSLALGLPTGDFKAMANHIKYDTKGGENSTYVKAMEASFIDLKNNLVGVDAITPQTIDEQIEYIEKSMEDQYVDSETIEVLSEATREILVLTIELQEAMRKLDEKYKKK